MPHRPSLMGLIGLCVPQSQQKDSDYVVKARSARIHEEMHAFHHHYCPRISSSQKSQSTSLKQEIINNKSTIKKGISPASQENWTDSGPLDGSQWRHLTTEATVKGGRKRGDPTSQYRAGSPLETAASILLRQSNLTHF